MNTTLVHQLPPTYNNPRNSEGAFIYGKNSEILFAYSRYSGDSCHDHASCDIYLIRSDDDGKTWSEPEKIAGADEFGTSNIMSVSAVRQKNGDIGFYFIIKHPDLHTTIGRTVSKDGIRFETSECVCDFEKAYYVINNDRIVRLSDGTLIAPTSFVTLEQIRELHGHCPWTASMFISHDDGNSWQKAEFNYTSKDAANYRYGYQEPGVIEFEDRLYYWTRTGYGRQYESVSYTGVNGFCPPYPSIFTSPPSPMQIKTFDGESYVIYNPIPKYDGREEVDGVLGRTPFVLRKSADGGKNWGSINIIADDKTRGYCYPAIIKTKDNHLLVGYCMGDKQDGNTLCRLGISRIDISTIS